MIRKWKTLPLWPFSINDANGKREQRHKQKHRELDSLEEKALRLSNYLSLSRSLSIFLESLTFEPSNHEIPLRTLLWIHLSAAKRSNLLVLLERSRENLHSLFLFSLENLHFHEFALHLNLFFHENMKPHNHFLYLLFVYMHLIALPWNSLCFHLCSQL